MFRPLYIPFLSKNILQYFCISALITLGIFPGIGQTQFDPQCSLSDINGEPAQIVDNDTFSLRFIINGANNPIVGQNFQGICGLRIKFRHQNVSDLEIRLTAPNGRQVILIGPATGNGTPPNFLQIGHTLTFRPRPIIVVSDPALASPDGRWVSSNVNWGSQSSYSGSYYPFSGDFGDFRNNPVAGIWELTVMDKFLNEEGLFEEFEIEFCDDAGMICNACEATAGNFTQDTISTCQNSSLDLKPFYQESLSDSTLYTEEFFVYNESGAFQMADTAPDFSLLDSGTYFVHAFNILESQYAANQTALQFTQRAFLVQNVRAPGGTLCMDISAPLVVIIKRPDTLETFQTLCPGEVVVFNGNLLSTSGIYDAPTDECDTLFRLRVEASQLHATFNLDSIYTDCTTGTIEYGPMVTGANGILLYEWSEVNGPVIGSDSAFLFSRGGDYQLLISDNICDTVIFINVGVSGAGFSAAIIPSTQQLNCLQDSSDLVIDANFIQDSVKWFKNNQLLAENVVSVRVGDEGEYRVEVYGGRGCMVADSFNLTTNTLIPSAVVTTPSITCDNPSVSVSYTSSDPIQFNYWLKGTDTIESGLLLSLSDSGDYQLLLVGTNMCDTLIPFQISADQDFLDIGGFPEGDTMLNCNIPSINIQPNRDVNRVKDEFWIFGVNDTFRNPINITISSANTYKYVVLPDNGCVTSREFTVSIDTIMPVYSLKSDSLTCKNIQAEISLSQLNASSIPVFNGPGIISESDSSITVDQEGVYSFVLADTLSGCTVTDSVFISRNATVPNVTLEIDSTITCQNPESELSANLNGSSLDVFYWISPESDTAFQQLLVVSDTGIFRFEALGLNGCLFSEQVIIADDRDLPPINLPSDVVVTCRNNNVELSITDLTDIGSIRWINGTDTITGPVFDQITKSQKIEVLIDGTNGCPSSTIINITYDTLTPSFSLVADTLNCTIQSVEIVPDEQLEQHTFTWAGAGIAGSSTNSVFVSEAGAYGLNVVDTTNGCAHLEVIDVFQDLTVPTYSISPVDTITCFQTSVNVSVITEAGNQVIWETSDGRQESGLAIVSNLMGKHYFEITGMNGCTTQDSIDVYDNLTTPRVTLEDTYVISCNQEQFILTPTILDPVRTISWDFKNGTSTNANSELITNDELESLTVVGFNGCATRVDFNISYANDRPDAVIINNDTVVCSGNSISLSTLPVVSASHRIFWYRNSVFLTENVISVAAPQTGSYILEVIDTSSGCFSSDTVAVIINNSPLTGITIDQSNETCAGDDDGFFQILEVFGGAGPLDITVGNEEIGYLPVEPAKPGNYNIRVEDDLGCSIDTIINIEAGSMIQVELGPDITVERGNKVSIVPVFTGGLAEQVTWTGSAGTTSSALDTLCYFPATSETIYIEATTATGCFATDSVFVSVFVDQEQIKIYVPNILVLNSNNANDLLTLSLPADVREIRDFSIYDRWGQKVMHIDQMSNGDVIVAWDGRFNNRPVASGVYVYSYQIMTIYDDKVRRISGDLTVIN